MSGNQTVQCKAPQRIAPALRSLRFVVLLSLLPAFSAPAAPESVLAPDWTLSTAAGATLRLSKVAPDQTTVLFFWATWCPYCKALMPHLQSIRLEHGKDVRILAINIFEDGDPVEFLASAGYDFTLLMNGDKVAEAYGVTGTPGLFVIDCEQRIRFDLKEVPRPILPFADENPGNSRKAAYMAPHWAAELRKGIDAASCAAR
jgi:thiol-disulfide isomerase/thioredoxin